MAAKKVVLNTKKNNITEEDLLGSPILSVKSWSDIEKITQNALIDFDSFVRVILDMSERSSSIKLSGWAQTGEQFPSIKQKNYEDEDEEAMGALTLNNKTFVFYCNPADGYRSHAGYVLLAPNLKLKTTFLPYEVTPLLLPLMVEGEEEPNDNELLSFCIKGTDDVAVSVGTERHDSYYPMAVFTPDPKVLDKHKERVSKEGMITGLSISLRRKNEDLFKGAPPPRKL